MYWIVAAYFEGIDGDHMVIVCVNTSLWVSPPAGF